MSRTEVVLEGPEDELVITVPNGGRVTVNVAGSAQIESIISTNTSARGDDGQSDATFTIIGDGAGNRLAE